MKSLAVVAMGENTAHACTQQLQQIMGNNVNISQYFLRENPPKNFQADVVLFASEEAYSRGKSICSPQAEVLIARRSINYHEVKKLLTIPSGTDVLLVNDLMTSTNTTIALLQTLGIDHINYHPCCPEMNQYPQLKIAVTPGETQLVPDFVETVIDIKTRLIDITTIVEVLLKLDLISVYAEFLSANYVRDIITLSKNSYHDVAEIHRLEELVREKRIREHSIAPYTLEKIIGKSKAITRTLTMAKKMAASDSTLLIRGESGTGKELIAQGIHNASSRRNGPFVAVNFAALSENLLESELFGHVAGAFTGANRTGAVGLFEEANQGTIFLDEIGDAPLSFQVKLLRVLQEKQIRRVGSSKVIPINVRVIAATNQNLERKIQEGTFREDLYYRLHVLPIYIPPLRERGQDVLLLATAMYNQKDLSVAPEHYLSYLKESLLNYKWPGNIRELQNLVEYLTTLSPDAAPKAHWLPPSFLLPPTTEHPDKASTNNDLQLLAQKVYREVRQANEGHYAIGRRSLAIKLQEPESRIREALHLLQSTEKIRSRRGRSGLLALAE